MPNTDHSAYIEALRSETSNTAALSADLLELHDRTGISLDHWDSAVEVIRATLEYIEYPGQFELQPNGA